MYPEFLCVTNGWQTGMQKRIGGLGGGGRYGDIVLFYFWHKLIENKIHKIQVLKSTISFLLKILINNTLNYIWVILIWTFSQERFFLLNPVFFFFFSFIIATFEKRHLISDNEFHFHWFPCLEWIGEIKRQQC